MNFGKFCANVDEETLERDLVSCCILCCLFQSRVSLTGNPTSNRGAGDV